MQTVLSTPLCGKRLSRLCAAMPAHLRYCAGSDAYAGPRLAPRRLPGQPRSIGIVARARVASTVSSRMEAVRRLLLHPSAHTKNKLQSNIARSSGVAELSAVAEGTSVVESCREMLGRSIHVENLCRCQRLQGDVPQDRTQQGPTSQRHTAAGTRQLFHLIGSRRIS